MVAEASRDHQLRLALLGQSHPQLQVVALLLPEVRPVLPEVRLQATAALLLAPPLVMLPVPSLVLQTTVLLSAEASQLLLLAHPVRRLEPLVQLPQRIQDGLQAAMVATASTRALALRSLSAVTP